MNAYEKFEITKIYSDPSLVDEVCTDWLSVEEPLEIRLVYGSAQKRKSKSLSITMRTPGNDYDLVAGFLVSENIIQQQSDLLALRFIGPFVDEFEFRSDDSKTFPLVSSPSSSIDFCPIQINSVDALSKNEAYRLQGQQLSNIVEVELQPELDFDFSRVQRHFYLTSSCGICGKASLDALKEQQISPLSKPPTFDGPQRISAALIHQLPSQLKAKQAVFQKTGGLHAAGLVSFDGQWLAIREDVGRHNAVDKLIGAMLLSGDFPLSETALILSGRASFELLQKSLLARIPIVVAVGAPSSLAVELAREFNITLIGFTTDTKFNVYSTSQRIS